MSIEHSAPEGAEVDLATENANLRTHFKELDVDMQRLAYERDEARARNKHLEDVLRYIAGSETPHANSTVKAMAKVARTALPPRAALPRP